MFSQLCTHIYYKFYSYNKKKIDNTTREAFISSEALILTDFTLSDDLSKIKVVSNNIWQQLWIRETSKLKRLKYYTRACSVGPIIHCILYYYVIFM